MKVINVLNFKFNIFCSFIVYFSAGFGENFDILGTLGIFIYFQCFSLNTEFLQNVTV